MKTSTLSLLLMFLLLAAPASAQLPDGDGDGVPDGTDLCPAEDASSFDIDGDGCIDPAANTRHLEYWSLSDLPLNYVIHSNGAAGIDDGSDFLAVQAGYDAWSSVPGTLLSSQYDGTTGDNAGNGLDGINLVSFEDPDFVAIYGTGVLAVGITTSFTTPTNFNGTDVRPGQIVDADMLFNPLRSFSTDTQGTGLDVQSVAGHEAGHLFGINHSAIETATMFPALPLGISARSLEDDDQLMAFMAAPDAATLPGATVLRGNIVDGASLAPIPGAAVFAVSVATGDTSGCQYTLPDGSYNFVGLAPGEYFVSTHPLNGAAEIKGVTPGFINDLVEATAQTLFVPEWWDAAESATDNASDMTPVPLAAGSISTIDIITNVDAVAPNVVSFEPALGTTDVRIDALVLLEYDESIDFDSAVSRFHFDRMDLSGPVSLGGSLVNVTNGKVLVFDPGEPLEYETTYRIRLDAGVEDLFGNPTGADFAATFLTEAQPAVSLSSLSPVKGVAGSIMTISGVGFDPNPAGNVVLFDLTAASIVSASPSQLVVNVPVTTGDQNVTVQTGLNTSNPILFTVLSSFAPLQGQSFNGAALSGSPSAVALLPDGNFAYAATSSGVSAVSLNAAAIDYGQEAASILLPGGTDDVAVSADGRRVYAVSTSSAELHVIDSDYVDLTTRSALFNQVLDTIALAGSPLGITLDAGGQRAYIPTAEGIVLVFDVVRTVVGAIDQSSLTIHRQVDQIVTPSPNLTGAIDVHPDGASVMVTTSAGELLVYDTQPGPMGEHPQLNNFSVGSDTRDVLIDPQGARAYISDDGGIVNLVDLITSTELPNIITGGSPRGMALSPTGSVLYVADRANDQISLVDLVAGNLTFRSVGGTAPTGALPVDVAVSPDGLLSYAVEKGSNVLSFIGVGFGPTVTAVSPPRAKEGDVVVIQGDGFIPWMVDQSFNIGQPVPYFNGIEGTLIRATNNLVEAIVPAGFTGGTVQVQNSGGAVAVGVPDDPISNAISLPLAESYGPFTTIFGERTEFTSFLGYDWTVVGVHNLVKASPRGDIVILTQNGGDEIVFFDTRPNSGTFQQPIKVLDATFAPIDIEFTPDGRFAYMARSAVTGTGSILKVDTDVLSPTFGTEVDAIFFDIALGAEQIVDMAMMPGGDFLVALDQLSSLFYADLREGINQDVVTDTSFALSAFAISSIVAHPSGRSIHAIESNGQGGFIHVIGNDPDLSSFRLRESARGIQETPLAVGFSKDGGTAYVAAADIVGSDSFVLNIIPMLDPYTYDEFTSEMLVDDNGGQGAASVLVSPNGEQMFVDTVLELIEYDIRFDPPEELLRLSVNGTGQPLGFDMTADGSRLYTASFADSYPRVLTHFRSELTGTSGDGQVGVAGETLPTPITVSVLNGDLSPTPDVSVFVNVTQGSGLLPNGTQFQVFNTDSQGKVSFEWTLGPEITPVPAPGTPTHELRIDRKVFGEPLTTFMEAVAVADPGTLPLDLVQILPADGSANVSVNTAVQATLSRAVAVASVDESSFFLHKLGDPTPIPAALGFADASRRISLTPLVPLGFSTSYVVEVGAGLADSDGGALTNPGSATFTTKAPPALSISSVSPPSAAVGTQVTIAGEGFDTISPGDNVVTFAGGAVASVLSASVSAVQVVLPGGATSGPITVEASSQIVTGPEYSVLVPTTEPLDEILATVDTGITTQSMALTPDGLRAYSVSTETNSVLPLDLATLVTGTPIAVGNTPVGIVINPEGTRAYVANFVSGTVSVIDLATDTVSATITGFINPFDIIMAPDGDNVYVIDTFDNTVNVIDTDDESGTFHGVTTRLSTGDSTKGAAISPDGTKLYLGTSDGFLIFSLEASDFGVTTRLTTGDSTKGAAITPDGSLLILVTDLGNVVVVDISPGGNNQVITRLTTGDSTKGAAISPDGGLLYILQEDSDEILVFQIEVVGSISAVENLGLLVNLILVDSVDAGSDPQYIVFDPVGSGLALVGNGGSAGGITVINSSDTPFGVLEATLKVDPRPLHLPTRGRYIKATICMPVGFSVHDIILSSVTMEGVIVAEQDRFVFEDEDKDGEDELVACFDRVQFQEIAPLGAAVTVTVTGTVSPDMRTFSASDVIQTERPTVTHPVGGEICPINKPAEITWTTPPGIDSPKVEINWSPDDGETWFLVVYDWPNNGSFPWVAPNFPTDFARVEVTLCDSKGMDIGIGMSPGVFVIQDGTVPVSLRGVQVTAADGDGLLSWSTYGSEDLAGFHVLRSEDAQGPYSRVTDGSVVGTGSGEERQFQFLDTEIKGNRTYYYKLQEDRPGGGDFEHGPFAFTMRVTNRLDQNFPNAFNPATTIRFAVANQGPVRLSVYNVAGRRVKVLINEVLEPDVYQVKWTGKDENGAEVSSGIYLYRLEAAGYASTKKMTLVR